MKTEKDAALAHWAALLAERNPTPPPPAETETFTCQRCKGKFKRLAGARRAYECPICGCKRWDAANVRFRKGRGGGA